MAAEDDDTKGSGAADGKPASKAGPERRERERRQRAPLTLDLAAEDVRQRPAEKTEPVKPPLADAATEASAAPKAAAAPPPPPTAAGAAAPGAPSAARTSGRAETLRGAAARALGEDNWRQTLTGAVAGALIALILVIVLQAIGLLPSPGRSTANLAAEQAKSAADASVALERRVTAIETMTESLPALKSDLKTIGDRVAALESAREGSAARSDLEALASAVASLREKLDAAPVAASRADLAALADRIGRLEVTVAAGGTGDGDNAAAITSLTDQLSSAEKSLQSLTDRLNAAEAKITAPAAVASDGAVKALAVAALRRASEGDNSFLAEVDMASALGVANDDIARLRTFAAEGVASKATLAADFPPVADAILSAAATNDPNAGFFQRVLNGLGGLVTIRPTGPMAGSDPAAIVSRMSADVASGDIAAALGERDALPKAGKDASAAWAAEASDRIALDLLIGRIATAIDATKT